MTLTGATMVRAAGTPLHPVLKTTAMVHVLQYFMSSMHLSGDPLSCLSSSLALAALSCCPGGQLHNGNNTLCSCQWS